MLNRCEEELGVDDTHVVALRVGAQCKVAVVVAAHCGQSFLKNTHTKRNTTKGIPMKKKNIKKKKENPSDAIGKSRTQNVVLSAQQIER